MQTKVNHLVNILFNRGETRSQVAYFLKITANYLIDCETGRKQLSDNQINILTRLVNIKF